MLTNVKQRLLITIPLIAALCIAIFYSISIGVADLYGYSPRQHLEHWQKKGLTPSAAELDDALIGINSAIRWHPRHAEYHDMQALLHYYQALDAYQQGGHEEFTQLTQQALAGYQQATQLRPHWPYSWANFALMKAMLQQFDEEYRFALTQATTLGPWENGVNLAVADAGMLGWLYLDKQTQTAVIDNIERGMKRNNKALKHRLTAINKLGLACIYLKESKQQQRLCRA